MLDLNENASHKSKRDEFVYIEGQFVPVVDACEDEDGDESNYVLIPHLNRYKDSPVRRVFDIVRRAVSCTDRLEAGALLTSELEPILTSVTARPRLSPDATNLSSALELGWVVDADDSSKHLKIGGRTARLSCIDEQSFRLIIEILSLASSGKLDKIRRCASCAQWMRARQHNQSFCCTYCRQKAFELNPTIRERRNSARRESYRREVEADRKRKEKLGFQRGGSDRRRRRRA